MNTQRQRPITLLFIIVVLILNALPFAAHAQTYPLEVYPDPNYGGLPCWSTQAERADIYVGCNDQISSIQLQPGWSVRVYRDPGANIGPSVCINRSLTDLSGLTFEDGSPANDAISSFALLSVPWCDGTPTPAFPLEVYPDPNYGGYPCWSTMAETANIYGPCDNQISSVLLRAGWSVKVFRDPNQSGPYTCITGNTSDLTGTLFNDGLTMNDAISSFVLYNQPQCANQPPHIPGITGPTGGTTLTNRTVSLGWVDGGDPDNMPWLHRTFYVEIWRIDNGWQLVRDWSATANWSLTVPSDGSYMWRVRAWDGWAAGSWAQGAFNVVTVPPADITPPIGNLTAPAAGTNIGPGVVALSADASDNTGGTGVDRVEFFVFFDGQWHLIAGDSTAPYTTTWTTPADLRSQIVAFGIHVIDRTGNRAEGPGGDREVSFTASSSNPGVTERWIPESQRAYLNQLALSDNGWRQCSVASMAMVLAMNGIIGRDFASMQAKANEMFRNREDTGHGVLGWAYNPDGSRYEVAYLGYMVQELVDQGMEAGTPSGVNGETDLSPDEGWAVLKQEIDARRPIIVRTKNGVVTGAGHFFVAVGYQESAAGRTVIVYDPYGEWQGVPSSYAQNSSDPASDKGRWVFYNFDTVFTEREYLIGAGKLASAATMEQTWWTPPDRTSTEPDRIVTFNGVPAVTRFRIHLPMIRW